MEGETIEKERHKIFKAWGEINDFRRILYDVLINEKTQVFFPVPEIFESFHSFLLRFYYPKIDFDLLKKYCNLFRLSING